MLITDRRSVSLPLPLVVARACIGGCRWISLREKDLPLAAQRDLLLTLRPIARQHGARLQVHGDLTAGHFFTGLVDGLHLPAVSLSDPDSVAGRIAAARALLGPDALIGLSCHDAAAVAQALGADYVTLSPLFPTPSKPGYGPALGPALLSALPPGTPPILALGGLTPATAAFCRRSGAAGMAVMGGIMRATDPRAATQALLTAWDAD